MASSPSNQKSAGGKKDGGKAAALLAKMTKMLESRSLADLEKTKQATKNIVYKVNDRRTISDLKSPRSRQFDALAERATALANECGALRKLYDEFVKQSAGLSDKDYNEQRDTFLKEIKTKREKLKSFWDTLRTKYNESSKFEEKVRKNAKDLKGEPEEFEKKIGFPLDEARKTARTLQVRGKHLIKIGVQIRRAEAELEFK